MNATQNADVHDDRDLPVRRGDPRVGRVEEQDAWRSRQAASARFATFHRVAFIPSLSAPSRASDGPLRVAAAIPPRPRSRTNGPMAPRRGPAAPAARTIDGRAMSGPHDDHAPSSGPIQNIWSHGDPTYTRGPVTATASSEPIHWPVLASRSAGWFEASFEAPTDAQDAAGRRSPRSPHPDPRADRQRARPSRRSCGASTGSRRDPTPDADAGGSPARSASCTSRRSRR